MDVDTNPIPHSPEREGEGAGPDLTKSDDDPKPEVRLSVLESKSVRLSQ